MKKFTVVTTVEVERIYEVEAGDADEARDAIMGFNNCYLFMVEQMDVTDEVVTDVEEIEEDED